MALNSCSVSREENRLFDDLVKELSDEEILTLKKKWGTTGDILEAEQRIEAIAADMVHHYVENILPNGFKAQVVCTSKMAAVHYKKYIDKAIAERLAEEQAKPAWLAIRRRCPRRSEHSIGMTTCARRSPF